MGEILADASALGQGVLDGRMDFGDARFIFKGSRRCPRACRAAQGGQRIAHRLFQFGDAHEGGQFRRGSGEFRRPDQVEMIVGQVEAVVAAPFQPVEQVFRQARYGGCSTTVACASMRSSSCSRKQVEVR